LNREFYRLKKKPERDKEIVFRKTILEKLLKNDTATS
jgi:hypothetical protein